MGFPSPRFSDSGFMPVEEAGMDGASIVSGSSRQGCGGDREWSVASSGRATVRCQRRERRPVAAACKPARTPAPQQQGGDRRSMRIKAHAGLILDAYKATPDITLAELQALLADHGTEVALGTIWRFFARRGITRKKDSACDRAGSPRHPEAARGMVRRSARSRSRAAHLHR